MKVFLFGLLLMLAMPANAIVIDGSDVSFGGHSYATFQDTTTSLTWLDLDNFWGATTYDSLMSELAGSGYHLATLSELMTLQSSMPAIPANFSSDAAIVGGNDNTLPGFERRLIWGIYEDGNADDGVSWSFRRSNDTTWNYDSNLLTRTKAFSDANPDLGAFVVANSVPEPPTLALMCLGLAGLVLLRRRHI
jgi:hypothetical protein